MCIFCKIVNGDIPSYKVYEDSTFLAFLDISQATIGHTLVIPKEHYNNIFDLDENTSNNIFNLVVILAKKLKEVLNIQDINILNNNGPLAGQTVNHFHIHLIPRYINDNLEINLSQNKLSSEEFINLVKRIKD